MPLRQIDDRRLVEPLAGVGTSVEHLLDDPAEEIGAVGEGLAYTPFSPLANGLLAGRYSNGERPAPGSRASVASRSAHLLDDPATVAKLREFDRIAETQEVTPAGLALGWLLNHPVVTAPIVSVSKESQWQGIHDALTLKWTGTVGELLDEVFGR